MIGTYVLSAGYYDAYYSEGAAGACVIAARLRAGIRDMRRDPEPTAPSSAFAMGEKMDDPIAMYLNEPCSRCRRRSRACRVFRVPAGLSDDGLPLGLQILGNAGSTNPACSRRAGDRGTRRSSNAKPALLKVA